jgi:cytochrome c biogenesis protein CcdA
MPLLLTAALWGALSLSAAGGAPSQQDTAALEEAPILAAAVEAARHVGDPHARAGALLRVAETYGRLGARQTAHELLEDALETADGLGTREHLYLEAGLSCARAGLFDIARRVAARVDDPLRTLRISCATAREQIEAALPAHAAAHLAEARDSVRELRQGRPRARGWLALAEVYAAGEMEAELREAVERALEEARGVAAEAERDVLLNEVAAACTEAGLPEEARRVAGDLASNRTRIALLCRVAGSHAEAGRPEEALAVLQVARQDAARIADPQGGAGELIRVGEAYSDLGHDEAALEALAAAEELADGVRAPREAGPLRRRLAGAYQHAGNRAATDRVLRPLIEQTETFHGTLALMRLYASNGDHERALDLVADADPHDVALSGQGVLGEMADVYYRAWGAKSGPGRVAALEPRELRDAVRTRYAGGLAAAGDYARAMRFAEAAEFEIARDEALMAVADACLASARSAEELQPARDVLEPMAARLDRLKLRAKLGLRLAEVGAGGQAVAALQTLEEELATEEVHSARAELLCEVAIAYRELGRHEAAQNAAAEAMAAAMKVGCASCRDDLVADMFERLRGARNAALALAAGERMLLHTMRAETFLDLARADPGITPEQREEFLRQALLSATRVFIPRKRCELLVGLALAYRDAGLRVTTAEADMLREAAASLAARGPDEEGPLRERPPPGGPAIRLVYFDRPGCELCDEVKAHLDELKGMIPRVRVETHDLTRSETAVLLNTAICERLDVPEQDRLVAPAVFSIARGLVGAEITLPALVELAEESRGLSSPSTLLASRRRQAESQLLGRYRELGLLVVVSAGLMDGLNPCAFSVIIFFLSYLAYVGRTRRQIVTAGIVFTVAVFLTYLALGLGLAGLATLAERWSDLIRRCLYGGAAAMALVAALLSFRDGLHALKGETSGFALALPEALRGRIRRQIAHRSRLGLTLGATVLLGVVVASFELPCTGQMYLPVIMFGLRNLPSMWGPLGWLVLYNLCFIVPLVVVFVAVLFGLTSERLTALFRRHLAGTKFAMAGVFALLGAAMIAFAL